MTKNITFHSLKINYKIHILKNTYAHTHVLQMILTAHLEMVDVQTIIHRTHRKNSNNQQSYI